MKTKKFILLLTISICISGLILSGCRKSVSKDQEFKQLLENVGWNDADIVTVKRTFVPDSLRSAMATWITETVRAASYHLTTSDYEDPEDVIEQAVKDANTVFSRTHEFEGLRVYNRSDERLIDKTYSELTNGQKKVFDYLKNNK